jgi:hypothetical protein
MALFEALNECQGFPVSSVMEVDLDHPHNTVPESL